MGRHVWRFPRPSAWLRASGLCVAVALVCAWGCTSKQTRLQSEDDAEHAGYDVKTLGDITTVANANPMPIGGVGLVEGLQGTGGEAPNDAYRTMLEDYLRKKGVKNIKQLMSSPNHAMVLISAVIPPGTVKGDRFDVEVRIPPRSRATSLRGGYLKECFLFNYDTTQNLAPSSDGPATMIRGHDVAQAEGKIEVGMGAAENATRLKQGRIYEGGRSRVDLPFGLVLNPDHQYAHFAKQVADRVNESLVGKGGVGPAGELATARNNMVITLRVPHSYRLNMPRYLRVVRLIPLHSTHDGGGENHAGQAFGYRQKLADDLMDPQRTVTASLRLEALGENSISLLKEGMDSKDVLVRFCSAEALAYLGSPAAGRELARVVEEQPRLRGLALTALASLDESITQGELRELLLRADDDEVRYGAFRALHTLNKEHPAVQGELLNSSYWVHRVATPGQGLVHITSTRRPEIVLFGEGGALQPPVSILAGDFAVTAEAGEDRCIVSYFPRGSATPVRRTTSLEVDGVIRTLAELGASYADVVEALRQAHECRSLTCRVRIDALPQAITVLDLVKAGKSGLAALEDPRDGRAGNGGDEQPRPLEKAPLSETELQVRARALLHKGEAAADTQSAGLTPRKGE